MLALAVTAGVGFLVTEWRSVEPFVEIRLYKHLAFTMASLAVFLNTMTFMAANFALTLFVQIHLQYTPLQAAWMLMPSAVIIGLLSVLTGRLSDFIPTKILVICGLPGSTLVMFQHATITAVTGMQTITLWFVIRGEVRSFTIAPLTTGSLATLPESDLRIGSGLLSLNRTIASAASVALTASLLQHRLAERMFLLLQEQSSLPVGADELVRTFVLTFKNLGDLAGLAQTKAMAMLQQLIDTEAALHSYHDSFIIIGLISAAAILPSFWLGNPAAKPEGCAPAAERGPLARLGSRQDDGTPGSARGA